VERSPDRPTALLPISHLVRLSIYWLGLVAVINGIGIILQERIKTIVPDPDVQYTTLGIVQVIGIVVAIVVQPTVGSISDYTVSRFGRRKPYILIGTTLDFVFLVGVATSNTVLSLAAFVTLLQFSSNFAQGPFQGYVPDLVPAAQVGLASAMVGMFTVLGAVIGTAFATLGLAIGNFLLPTIALGVLHFATMVSMFFRLDEGRPANTRGGRGWGAIAALTWGTDILRERSFLLLVGSRFFIRTDRDAPRGRIVAVDAGASADRKLDEIVPQSEAVLSNAAFVGNRLVLQVMKDASERARRELDRANESVGDVAGHAAAVRELP